MSDSPPAPSNPCPCGGACHEEPAYTHGPCCERPATPTATVLRALLYQLRAEEASCLNSASEAHRPESATALSGVAAGYADAALMVEKTLAGLDRALPSHTEALDAILDARIRDALAQNTGEEL